MVAAGATHSYFGKDYLAEFAPGMKTVEDARYLRDAILSKFEIATDPQERAEWLTFVVIGAGPTGVELVGQIAELAHTVLPKDYRSVNTSEARIILLEGAGAVLPPFAKKLQDYTRRRLEKMGVEVRVNSLAVDMDHETIRARTRIWAAGVQASPAGGDAGPGRRCRDRPRRAGAGGAGLHPPGPPRGVRHRRHGLVEQAPRHRAARDTGGQYVGRVIKARKTAETVKPFEYFDKGTMATIGYRSAVADAFGMKFTGFIAYAMWAFIHVLYLIGWGNRLGTLYTWARALWFGHNRAHRVITVDTAKKDVAEGRLPSGRPTPILPLSATAAAAAKRDADAPVEHQVLLPSARSKQSFQGPRLLSARK